MRLFDFVEQQHAMRLLRDGFSQQTALIESDIARRRANQPADRMTFHILGHVEAQQFDTQRERQLLRHFRLADTCRA